ncbi:MAG TPA: polyhydroxyalkanoic acid system family protein [Thermoanaerobaculia bacterium]|nr:polyhydroxyalkanoic acid system family protein [Thermoanaerobaculia bacterium]
MKVTVPHHTTREEAKRKVEERMSNLEKQYGHYATDIDKQWDGDRLTFSVKARGMTGSGSLEITDSEVILDGKLPLMARPFESRIKSTIEREAAAMFG